MSSKPLISFYVIACNQEHFIAEAVDGAFAQTWSPLEIVLSDDCSDDSTFDIMTQMASDYRGQHKIVLNRNNKRLGVGTHINRILQLCTGEWIVASAGDDISSPERAEKLYNHWLTLGRKPGLVYSNIIEIKEDGSLLYERDFRKEVPGEYYEEQITWNYNARLLLKNPPVHGAAFGYPRCTFYDFGPLWDGVVFEDNVLNWRAELTGGISLCPSYLVRHRNHSNQLTNIYSQQALRVANIRRRMLKWSNVQSFKQNLFDAKFALSKGWIEDDVYKKVEKMLNDRIQWETLEYQLFWSFIIRRWYLLIKNWRTLNHKKKINEILFTVLPRNLYTFALYLIAYWREKKYRF